jgi:hypothetical protein
MSEKQISKKEYLIKCIRNCGKYYSLILFMLTVCLHNLSACFLF